VGNARVGSRGCRGHCGDSSITPKLVRGPVLKRASPKLRDMARVPIEWGRRTAFGRLYRLTSLPMRRRLFWLFPVMAAGALAEMATLVAAVPLISIILQPGTEVLAPMLGGGLGRFFEGLGRQGLAVLLGATLIIAPSVRLFSLRRMQGYVMDLAHEYSATILSNTISKTVSSDGGQDPNAVLASVEKVQVLVHFVLLPTMAAINACMIAAALLGFLIFLEPVYGLVAIGVVGACYLIIGRWLNKALHANAETAAGVSLSRLKLIREMLGNLREVHLSGTRTFFENEYSAVDGRFRRAQAQNSFYAAAPRFVLEAVGFLALGALAIYLLSYSQDRLGAIAVLGAVAIGSLKMLPAAQTIYSGWSQARGAATAVDHVIVMLSDVSHADVEPAAPTQGAIQQVTLEDVSLRRGGQDILDDISLTIRAGDRIGLIGQSGSGKSTLLDVLMGFAEPSAGRVRLDGEPLTARGRAAWQARIGYVPQSVYLLDASVTANIAFGVFPPAVDLARVHNAARIAQINDVIEQLPDGYDTRLGHRGARLSGGQQQRIAIARALYRDIDLLVLDEATANVDHDTEAAIIEGLARLPRSITVVSAAHRASALAFCDSIVELKQGRIVSRG
jgi:ABC-type multidrug transport system fused ATPase/permease subunit